MWVERGESGKDAEGVATFEGEVGNVEGGKSGLGIRFGPSGEEKVGEHLGLTVPFGGRLAEEIESFRNAMDREVNGVTLNQVEPLGGIRVGKDGEKV